MDWSCVVREDVLGAYGLDKAPSAVSSLTLYRVGVPRSALCSDSTGLSTRCWFRPEGETATGRPCPAECALSWPAAWRDPRCAQPRRRILQDRPPPIEAAWTFL